MKGLRATFDNDFPDTDFRNIGVHQEFPITKESYPSIWMDYDPSGPLTIMGIGHDEDSVVTGGTATFYRWSFAGVVSFTAIALSSFERDRLIDAIVQVLAFSKQSTALGAFRSTMQDPNSLIGMNANWDEIDQRGFSVAPGTPWGTDEMMYEGTVAIDVIGEFVSTPTGVLVPTSKITLIDFIMGGADPGWP